MEITDVISDTKGVCLLSKERFSIEDFFNFKILVLESMNISQLNVSIFFQLSNIRLFINGKALDFLIDFSNFLNKNFIKKHKEKRKRIFSDEFVQRPNFFSSNDNNIPNNNSIVRLNNFFFYN